MWTRVGLCVLCLTIFVSRKSTVRGQDVISVRNDANECRTPEGAAGTCIPINNCPDMVARLNRMNTVNRRYVQSATCRFEGFEPFVCCNLPDNVRSNSGVTRRPAVTTLKPQSLPQTQEGCGLSSVGDMTRVIGGTPAELNEWPWIAAIFDEMFNRWFFLCGGTLINANYVLTAAHCGSNRAGKYPVSKLRVRLGELNLESDSDGATPIEFSVSEIKLHPDYDWTVAQPILNDIALLRLARPATFSESIRPACLPAPELRSNSFADFNPFVIGWGRTESGVKSDVLRQVQLPVWQQSACRSVYDPLPIGASHICAGLQKGGKDSCQGDSGGPLLFPYLPSGATDHRWTVIGVVSTGPEKCGQPGFPGIYSRVTFYMDWINSNAN